MELKNYLDSLSWRYATKLFDTDKKIDQSLVDQILNSARLAPSSFGLQPWRFLVIKDPAVRAALRPHAWDQPQITDASHLIVLAGRQNVDAAYIHAFADRIAVERGLNRENIEGYRQMMLQCQGMMQGENGRHWVSKQVYIALGTLVSACAVAKIDSCPMEGFDPAKFDEILGLGKKGLFSVVLLSIGYRSASDKSAVQKKVRFNMDEVVEEI